MILSPVQIQRGQPPKSFNEFGLPAIMLRNIWTAVNSDSSEKNKLSNTSLYYLDSWKILSINSV